MLRVNICSSFYFFTRGLKISGVVEISGASFLPRPRLRGSKFTWGLILVKLIFDYNSFTNDFRDSKHQMLLVCSEIVGFYEDSDTFHGFFPDFFSGYQSYREHPIGGSLFLGSSRLRGCPCNLELQSM